jgi:imidazolonepropionase-like amidohydrolase
MRRFLSIVATLVLLLAAGFYFVAIWPMRDPHPPVKLAPGVWAIQDATIYTSPDAPPIQHGALLVRDGRIAAVGTDIALPIGARTIPCDHCVVTAGFWNAHVHFTEPKWLWSTWLPAGRLNAQLADMLTSRGFTTVVDAGSDLRETLSLRRRIESSELAGPKIYTAGAAQYPPHGIPYYLRETLPPFLLRIMPQPATPAEAARDERYNIARGADLLKLFTGSLVERNTVLPMPEANARAAVEVAHAHGQLAFCHPSNLAGVQVAMASGVDVLAHAPSETNGVDAALLRRVVDLHMAMVPTLKMFGTTVTKNPAFLQPIYAEVRQFHAFGGQLLFGTDVGYMRDYTTEDEFAALEASGLNAMDILRMLTTAPAERFGVASDKGTIAPGKLADLVLLDADPATGTAAFARVRTTIRGGRILYSR